MIDKIKIIIEGILIVGGLVLLGCSPTAWLM